MRIAYKSFTGGEVAPSLAARYDLQKYAVSARCMENFLPGLHGDVTRRPGTRFVAELDSCSVLIPFSFNSDPAHNFCLIFSHQALRIASATRLLAPVLPTPYTSDELYEISSAQVGDVVYLAHPGHPLRKVLRSGTGPDYVWRLEEVALNCSLPAPPVPGVTFRMAIKGNENDDKEEDLTHTLRYKVTAVDARGRESLASEAGEAPGKHPSDWVVGNSATVRWRAVPGAVEYNLYREEAGYFGFMGTVKGTAAKPDPIQARAELAEHDALAARLYPEFTFTDNNYEADTSDTPREDWNPFAGENHPGFVAFHQQRMVLGGTRQAPHSFYLSRVGDFENFRKSRPVQDDDPVEYTLTSGSIDAIQWAASFGDLLLGSSGAEYKASGENGLITAKNVAVMAQSYWGSRGGMTPLIIGNSVLHVQRHGNRVRDLFYSLERDGYTGNDLSILAPHLVEGQTLCQWCYQQTPGSRVWMVRDDGVLLCLTYLKEHEIYGWSRHLTQGAVVSVAVISGAKSDLLMLVVRRRVDGRERYFLEHMAEPFAGDADIREAFFVDCGVSFRSAQPEQELRGLEHLEGCAVAVLADGAPVEGLRVQNGTITLPFAARVVHVGLPYASVLAPVPVEADTQNGSTLGLLRAFGRCLVRLHRSVGGKYGASRDRLYEFPFLPERYDAPCPLFSGDLECFPHGGQEPDATIWLVQDKPLPWQVLAVAGDLDFGQVSS